ncbi:MAG: hypothetical protein KF905_03165 [Flavobacteriales bacterium]|nr:hypothetical protein [Flavobacteriales bacterium]
MQITLRLHAKPVVFVLFAVLAGLLAMHTFVALSHLVFQNEVSALTVLFDMDREANVPTLFNVLLFFLGAVLFYLLGRAEQGRDRWAWRLMVFAFIFLGVDEGSQIHERFMLFTLRLMGHDGTTGAEMGFLYYAWIIPYFIAAVVLFGVLGRWLLRLEAQLRWGLLLSGAIFVFGAVFMESFSGNVAAGIVSNTWNPADHPSIPCHAYPAGQCMLYADPLYVALYTMEEMMEMSGLILCAGFLMRGLERREAKVLLELGKP